MVEDGLRLTPLLEALRAQNPDKSPVYTAIQSLTTSDLMTQFFFEYANSLKRSQNPQTREHPFDAAATEISKMTSFFGPDYAKRWHSFLQTGRVRRIR